jgi:hypothetical protein
LVTGWPNENDESHKTPSQVSLVKNYPNPFNTSTTFEYNLPKASDVKISIYNLMGQKIDEVSIPKCSIKGSVTWDATEFSSGIYFARLSGAQSSNVIKLLLMK